MSPWKTPQRAHSPPRCGSSAGAQSDLRPPCGGWPGQKEIVPKGINKVSHYHVKAADFIFVSLHYRPADPLFLFCLKRQSDPRSQDLGVRLWKGEEGGGGEAQSTCASLPVNQQLAANCRITAPPAPPLGHVFLTSAGGERKSNISEEWRWSCRVVWSSDSLPGSEAALSDLVGDEKWRKLPSAHRLPTHEDDEKC